MSELTELEEKLIRHLDALLADQGCGMDGEYEYESARQAEALLETLPTPKRSSR